MQFNSYDMDDLFRRAADGYPLNTKGADWEKLSVLLKQEPKQKGGNRKQFLWLLLLLPVALICNRGSDGWQRSGKIAVEEAKATAQKKTTGSEAQQSAATAVVIQQKLNLETASEMSLEALSTPTPSLQKSSGTKVQQAEKQNVLPTGFAKFDREKENAISSAVSSSETDQETVNEVFTKTVEEPATVDRNNEKNVVINDSTASSPDAKKNETLAQKTTSVKKRRFYIGAIAGPDWSTVRFEKFSRAGFGAGILLGYALSDRFSVETGALSSKKYYYSEGEYLNSKKLYLPPNTTVLAVDGNCRMLELPVSVLYNWKQSPSRSWFASAGISSYLMKKEDYTYDYLYGSSGSVVSHNKVYRNATKNWMSVLQLSVGYSAKISSAANLRLEPYYTLPLKGIGYGELPLTSFGLKLGIISKKF